MIVVAIPTRDRAPHVRTCVASILAGDEQPDEILVVDQSAGDDTRALIAELESDRLRYVRAESPGTSAARNAAGELTAAEYVAFLDDDITVPPEWFATVVEELDRHGRPDALFGEMRAPEGQVDAKGLAISAFPVTETRVWSGMTPPSQVGFGAHAVLRRETLLALGGFDTRLGPGTRCYSAEDIDLNYRLLRSGASVVTSSRLWVVHHQWRPPAAIPRVYYRYSVGHSSFCMKHLLQGDRYPLRLVAVHALGDLKLLASAVRRRSFLRARASLSRAVGTWHGLARGWALFRR